MPRPPYGFDAVSHEKHHGWRSALFKLAAGSISVFLAWWTLGGLLGLMVGALVSVRFLGPALAPELVALGGELWRRLRGVAFAPVRGRFYQFKGHRIRVEDDELLKQRWIALQDLATALGSPIPRPALSRRWPEGLLQYPDGLYVLDEVALAWLAEQRDDRAGRLRLWVERDVWYPARGRGRQQTQKGAPGGAPPKPD